MHRMRMIVLVLLATASYAPGSPYWTAWEGNDWPEAVGYERNWGDSEGHYHGPGANLTLEYGVLAYNSLYDPTVFDVYGMGRFGDMDPDPGEQFVMEWGLTVDTVAGEADPGVSLFSDGPWALALVYGNGHLCSLFEGLLNIPLSTGVYHDYRITSSDMREYDLYVDQVLLHHGAFGYVVSSQSRVSFGDQSATAGSVHYWDYFRFGVITPEASCLKLLMWVVVALVARRR